MQSPQGQPIAFLANYSLHYVGGVSGPVGRLLRHVRRAHRQRCSRADQDFVGIMSNGTSGDINNVNFGKAGPGKQAQPANRPASSPRASPGRPSTPYKNIKHHDWVPLKMAQKEIELGVRLPSAEAT